ncbi:MAG: hypothetical protein FJ116_07725 [Deltaproteobacteria bacterium]|nr:hypothetical protein [Deltaproteobacteria bacterium]
MPKNLRYPLFLKLNFLKPLNNIWFSWGLFALYIFILFTFPITILGSYFGLIVGVVLSLAFLFFLFFGAKRAIESKLNLTPLTYAENPELHHSVLELSRRLSLPPLSLKLLKTEALTIGSYGLRKSDSHIILSQGLLNHMSRKELSALLARQLTAIWYGDTLLATWLSRLLFVLELVSFTKKTQRPNTVRSKYSLGWLVGQMIFMPLAMIPRYLLLSIRRHRNLNLESTKVSRLPAELAEALRKMEATAQRKVFHASLSMTPLFLNPPITQDPISKLLFSESFDFDLLTPLNQPVAKS